jgi:hypothetical protein
MNVEPEIGWITFLVTIFRHFSSGRRYAVITALFLIFFYAATGKPYGTTEFTLLTGGLQVPDISFTYSSASVYSLLGAFGQNGRDIYMSQILPLDTIFAITYLFFFGTTMSILIRYLLPGIPELQGLVILPLVGAISDIIENVCFSLMMLMYPTQLPLVVSLASVFTKLKFVSNGITMALIIASLVYLGIRYGKRLCN